MGLDVKDLWVLFLSCLVLLSVSLMQESGVQGEREPSRSRISTSVG